MVSINPGKLMLLEAEPVHIFSRESIKETMAYVENGRAMGKVVKVN